MTTADVTVADVEDWLGRYKQVWEEADDQGVRELFTPGALYIEMPFQEPFRGQDEIADYWRRQVVAGQRDIRFAATVVAVAGPVAVAHWTVTLRRLESGRFSTTDGIFRMTFAAGGAPLVCACFEEWWHFVESDSAVLRTP